MLAPVENTASKIRHKEMSTRATSVIIDRLLYTPLDLSLQLDYAVDQWSTWIDRHDADVQLTSKQKYDYYKSVGRRYPWSRVEAEIGAAIYDSLAHEFPLFVKYLALLPLRVTRVIFIKQHSFLEGPFHSDLDNNGIGFRICLAGNGDERVFKVVGIKREHLPIDFSTSLVNAGPYYRVEHGLVSRHSQPLIDWRTLARPSGISTGVAWAVTSSIGLHAVEQLEAGQERIQALVFGPKDIRLTESLLERSLQASSILVDWEATCD